METSAKDSTNVKIAFEKTFHEIYRLLSKNVTKEIEGKVYKIEKGISLDTTESENKPNKAKKQERTIKLTKNKANSKKKRGCC